MPARVEPFAHDARSLAKTNFDTTDPLRLLETACNQKPKDILQSSFTNGSKSQTMISSRNGLVYSFIKAYNWHQHLQIRPEDLWFAILTQISSYINAHAEDLRTMFVAHEGQKELRIESAEFNRHSRDFSSFAQQMTWLIEANILDPDLRDWVLPGFTTTTSEDNVVASILMMATMQKFFTYRSGVMCGLPSVTLLGQKEDYEKILRKLDKLPTFGYEPAQFADALRPILQRMVATFDDAANADIIDFWRRVVHVHSGSGSLKYSGWITGFCFWDKDGKCLQKLPVRRGRACDDPHNYRTRGLVLDDIQYTILDDSKIPSGWSKVPVIVDDIDGTFNTEMVAGSVGIAGSSSGRETENGDIGLDTMQPVTGWWIFEPEGANNTQQKRTITQSETQASMAAVPASDASLTADSATAVTSSTTDDQPSTPNSETADRRNSVQIGDKAAYPESMPRMRDLEESKQESY